MYLYLSLFKKKMINSIIIRGQLGVSLVAEIKKQTCQAQWSSPTRKKLRFCPNWRPPSSSQGYPKIPIIHDIAFMKCGFPHIYGHLQEDYVLETFDKKFGLPNPPPCPCTDKNKILLVASTMAVRGFPQSTLFVKSFQKKIFLVVSVNVRKPTLHKRKALHHELTGFLDNPGLGGVSWDKISTFSEWGCFAKLGKFASSATKDTPLQIMIELSYFFLDQWEVEIHLLHWASRPMTASNTKRSF